MRTKFLTVLLAFSLSLVLAGVGCAVSDHQATPDLVRWLVSPGYFAMTAYESSYHSGGFGDGIAIWFLLNWIYWAALLCLPLRAALQRLPAVSARGKDTSWLWRDCKRNKDAFWM